jgi:hypothetical protein
VDCGAVSSILSEELLGCDDDAFLTCKTCIDLQGENKVCGHFNYNAYCMLNGERYYVCPPLSVFIDGPSQLNPGQWGTFFADVDGGRSPYTYQWYKRVECLDNSFNEQDPPGTDDLPCGKWYSYDGNSSSVQAMGWWDFSMKVVVTADCYEPPVVIAEHYVSVGGSLAKRNEGAIHEQLSLKSPDLTYEMRNYPNPFNAGTTINFSLPEANRVSLVVYNTQGRRIRALIPDQELASGQHKVTWNGKNDHGEDVASGVYLCRLMSGNIEKLIRLVMIK